MIEPKDIIDTYKEFADQYEDAVALELYKIYLQQAEKHANNLTRFRT